MNALRAENLHFAYQDKVVLDDVSFSLPRGKLVGIVGPNGSGKSTLLKLLARQLPLQRGTVEIHGKPLTHYSLKALARELAFLPQRPVLAEGIRVEQLVQYGRHPHQGWLNQWSEEDAHQVARARKAMQLDAIWQRSATSLSGGQAQRAWLGMILAQNTDLILLDEPTSALDIGHQAEVMEAVYRIAAAGRTVLIVIHDLGIAARYCDELIALADGRVQAIGPPRQVMTKALVDRLYDTDVDILHAPGDGAPVIVPRRRGALAAHTEALLEHTEKEATP
ncbi:MAG: ATP-binding cassette domain-containing protein [Pseudomonas stutzeri]|uniref:ABC transporter ATP-binding protein n=1 Tax=Stutzerimonas stutzeri TaxID=316 RepID=UPI000650F599|nr:ABC transporter ATP-binding protein [Stutzerimonas stutzeri]AKN26820.1 Fe3 siderophore ABC transporter ATP-binding protein [Stutzerimonas stutzeri]NIM31658.1 ATP-binding cassette domain-containing protein [Stutzerimonas stutzeri]NIM55671.1 ATP-binding cassette domain-containing protein [Stutzerimonas stutzeri]NIM87107.1 ATP-binding cassette domain-containing protein [Stutzerimonas stutzeri]NIN81767.1 ATP-binding cassette domain-containing protein [Stutzerimonas stutzeri]